VKRVPPNIYYNDLNGFMLYFVLFLVRNHRSILYVSFYVVNVNKRGSDVQYVVVVVQCVVFQCQGHAVQCSSVRATLCSVPVSGPRCVVFQCQGHAV